MNNRLKWEDEAEVVVVGYGGAGIAAAIAAHDAGARVLIMEKQVSDTATTTNHTPSTRMSGGGWLCPDDPEKARQYLRGLARIANETCDAEREELIKVLSERMVDNTNWMRHIGAEIGGQESFSPTLGVIAAPQNQVRDTVFGENKLSFSDFSDLPGAECCHFYWVKSSGEYRHGASFFKALSDAVQKRHIPVLWGMPGEHLLVEGGAVRGVTGQRGGKTVAIKATRGVILACGGFEFNDYMKENYLRPIPIHFYGNPGNTGEGISMAQEVGADLWHMNCVSFRVTIKVPEYPVAFGTQHHEEKSIFVDKRGNRFTNERVKMHAFGYELTNYDCYAMCYPRVPCYWIFDEKRRISGPVASYQGVCNPPGGIMGPIHYIWSEDNLAEIDRGWIIKARTIEELAAKIAADPDNGELMTTSNLRTTVRRYNRFCRAGEDLDFHRPQWSLAPLEDPPYYAIKLWPGGPNTQGGPRRNKNCQVVRPDRTPVPRLYACGELGASWGMLYQGGGNLAENIALGRLVGENAAAQSPWR
ncbi:FAD-dependent oxidoreductase [Chloroflexota bacterium]